MGISQDPVEKTYILVLQFANGGNLRTYLHEHFPELDWLNKINMAKDIARGLKYIHDANIVHRDLHSKNILIHKGRLMITDLGLSKSLDETSESLVGGMIAYADPHYLNDPLIYKRSKSSDLLRVKGRFRLMALL